MSDPSIARRRKSAREARLSVRRASTHDRRSLFSSLARELLDAWIVLDHEDVAVAVDRDAEGGVELPVRTAQAAPLGHEDAVAGELLDAIDVGSEEISGAVRGDRFQIAELTAAEAEAAPLAQERSRVRKFLNAVVEVIGDEEIAVGVRGNATLVRELTVAGADTPPLGEEG